MALVVTTLSLLAAVSAYGLSQAPPDERVPHPIGHARRRPPPAAPASLIVSPAAAMTPVPRSFLGLSTEYWALPVWASQTPLLERVLTLLKVPANGPFVLRVGGDSADHSFWDPRDAALPGWAYSLEPSWLTQARRLVADLRIRLILDLNLITDTPAIAADWARAAEAGLPRASIVGFEVGNEPDIYSRAGWLAITARRQYLGRPLPSALTPADYAHAFRTYGADLRRIAPRVPLAGPALARPKLDAGWVEALVAADRRTLGMVTVHRYPYSACAHRGSAKYPTIGRILSPTASAGVAASLQPAIDAAHHAGLPIRLTEVNSVTCGGLPGVSDTYATALWAPDTLFDVLRAGVAGINLHVRADTINAPFALTANGLVARPLLYGLIFFAHALGPRARLVSLALHAPARLNLQADAVRAGADALHVVLIDKGRRAVRVSLGLPAVGPAVVQRLLGPSPAARAGVTLDGQSLSAAGRWQGVPRDPVIAARARGRYTVTLRAFSAALLGVRLAPGALGVARIARSAATGAPRARGAGSAPPTARSPRR